ncbi:MAG TPA: ribbon-helix-helix protein, CopG family [Bdellovibrionota bacterium]|nr:ribbon-helix-helix protein, CopG family [Bdellovibrionota bacterium]
MKKQAFKTINISLPQWLVEKLDEDATAAGISRKALINVLLISIARRIKSRSLLDLGYLQAVEKIFAEEWESPEDEEAFRGL